ncbi:hypothetical protein M8J75_014430 [Diaphorina citri]|nr:hypothetical protein M8J75_014430 [Diaphorina citri]
MPTLRTSFRSSSLQPVNELGGGASSKTRVAHTSLSRRFPDSGSVSPASCDPLSHGRTPPSTSWVAKISSVVPTFVPESSRTAQLRGFRSAFGTPSSASSSHSGSHSIEELTQENSSNAPHGDGSHRMVDGTSRRGELLRDRKMQDNFVDRRIGLGTRGAYQLKHSPSTGMESPPRTWHIKRRELHAVFWTISRNPEIFRDRSVTLLTDSTVVAGQIRNQGGLRSPSLLEETWNLLHLVSSLNA